MPKTCQGLKIIFFGTPEFGAVVLEKLCKTNYKPCLVITSPDKPVGRKQIITPPPVKLMAKSYGIDIIQPEQIINSKSEILKLKPDLIVVAAYGKILPKDILEIPKHGCLNVHPSLLPKYRGSSPIQTAILGGDKETGAAIILMDAQMDHGPILAQRKTAIASNETFEQLHGRLAVLGGELLIDTIPDWIGGKIRLWQQDEKKATYTKILRKEDGKINWKRTAKDIEQKIRALNPWPSAYTEYKTKNKESKMIKILKAGVLVKTKVKPLKTPGKTFLAPDNKIAVQCKKSYLAIEELQLEGKRKMTSEEFLQGHSEFIGAILK